MARVYAGRSESAGAAAADQSREFGDVLSEESKGAGQTIVACYENAGVAEAGWASLRWEHPASGQVSTYVVYVDVYPSRRSPGAMPRFVVRLEGSDCWVLLEQRRWFGLKRKLVQQRWGFYTTRFVDAASEVEAARRAEALVRDELTALTVNPPEHPFRLAAEAVWEDRTPGAHPIPGSGFTRFSQEGQGDSGEVEIREVHLR